MSKVREKTPVKNLPLRIEAIAVRRRNGQLEIGLTLGGVETILLCAPADGDFEHTLNAQDIWEALRSE